MENDSCKKRKARIYNIAAFSSYMVWYHSWCFANRFEKDGFNIFARGESDYRTNVNATVEADL